MPLCEVLFTGPCPKSRNDSSVRLGEGDLMLCPDCDKVRFQEFMDSHKKAGSVHQTVANDKSARASAIITNATDTTTGSASSKSDDADIKQH